MLFTKFSLLIVLVSIKKINISTNFTSLQYVKKTWLFSTGTATLIVNLRVSSILNYMPIS